MHCGQKTITFMNTLEVLNFVGMLSNLVRIPASGVGGLGSNPSFLIAFLSSKFYIGLI